MHYDNCISYLEHAFSSRKSAEYRLIYVFDISTEQLFLLLGGNMHCGISARWGICKMLAGFTRRGIYKMLDSCGIYAEFFRGMRNLYKMRDAGCGIFGGILVGCGILAGFMRKLCGMRNLCGIYAGCGISAGYGMRDSGGINAGSSAECGIYAESEECGISVGCGIYGGFRGSCGILCEMRN